MWRNEATSSLPQGNRSRLLIYIMSIFRSVTGEYRLLIYIMSIFRSGTGEYRLLIYIMSIFRSGAVESIDYRTMVSFNFF
jgi:hypothetical protein